MGPMFQSALAAYESNLLQSDSSDDEPDEHDPPITPLKEQENETTLDSLIQKKSSTNDSKSSHEVSKADALASFKQDLNTEVVGDAIDDDFASVINNLLEKGLQNERLQERLNKMARPSNVEGDPKTRNDGTTERRNDGIWPQILKPGTTE